MNKSMLRDRCKAMYQQMRQDAMLRQGSPVDDLLAFVLAERGRTGDEALSASLPLCLYFDSEESRQEFIEMFQEAKPNCRMKKLP